MQKVNEKFFSSVDAKHSFIILSKEKRRLNMLWEHVFVALSFFFFFNIDWSYADVLDILGDMLFDKIYWASHNAIYAYFLWAKQQKSQLFSTNDSYKLFRT